MRATQRISPVDIRTLSEWLNVDRFVVFPVFAALDALAAGPAGAASAVPTYSRSYKKVTRALEAIGPKISRDAMAMLRCALSTMTASVMSESSLSVASFMLGRRRGKLRSDVLLTAVCEIRVNSME